MLQDDDGPADGARSWKVEVVVDGDAKWYSNQVRFKSREDAVEAGESLSDRWTLVRKWRVTLTCEPPNR